MQLCNYPHLLSQRSSGWPCRSCCRSTLAGSKSMSPAVSSMPARADRMAADEAEWAARRRDEQTPLALCWGRCRVRSLFRLGATRLGVRLLALMDVLRGTFSNETYACVICRLIHCNDGCCKPTLILVIGAGFTAIRGIAVAGGELSKRPCG